MTVTEFYDYMCRELPAELTLSGDADGMSCCPEPEREVRRVLIALDVTADIVNEAVDEGYDVILAHHPMFFGGIDAIHADNYKSSKLIRLIRGGVAVMSFHTRLDAADGGVNDILASLIGLTNLEKHGENGILRVGELSEPLFAEALAAHVKGAVGAPCAEYSDGGKLIRRVAVCGGSANSCITDAINAKADALVGGEFKYHELTNSADYGLSLVAAGHFFTENPVCSRLFELALAAGVEPSISFSNRIGIV